MKRIGMGMALMAVLTLAAACGGSGAPGSTTPPDGATTPSTGTAGVGGGDTSTTVAVGPTSYQSLLAAEFALKAQDPTEMPMNPQEALCIANGVVADLGESRLSEVGYNPATAAVPSDGLLSVLDEDEREAVAHRVLGCVDVTQRLVDAFVASGLTSDQAQCVAEAYAQSHWMIDALSSPDYDATQAAGINEFMSSTLTSCGADPSLLGL